MVKATGPHRPDHSTIGNSTGRRDYPMSTHGTKLRHRQHADSSGPRPRAKF